MNYDEFITHGLNDQDGGFLWNCIKEKCLTHNQCLAYMGELQRQLATYSKTHKMDQVQLKYVRDIRLLEIIAWRMFMYGPRWGARKPGRMGEFEKRRRTDPAYWRMRALCGDKKSDKWLKMHMRYEWEKGVLSRYKY